MSSIFIEGRKIFNRFTKEIEGAYNDISDRFNKYLEQARQRQNQTPEQNPMTDSVNAARPAHVDRAYNILENHGEGVRLDDLLFALTVVMTYQRDQQITDKIKAMQGHQNEVKLARELINALTKQAKDNASGEMVIDAPHILSAINELEKSGIILDFGKNATVKRENGAVTKITLPEPTAPSDAKDENAAKKEIHQKNMKTVTDQLDAKIKELGTSLEMQNLELQQLMSRRTQGIEISTQIQSKLEKAKDSVIRNV